LASHRRQHFFGLLSGQHCSIAGPNNALLMQDGDSGQEVREMQYRRNNPQCAFRSARLATCSRPIILSWLSMLPSRSSAPKSILGNTGNSAPTQKCGDCSPQDCPAEQRVRAMPRGVHQLQRRRTRPHQPRGMGGAWRDDHSR
jgi:hypothetical protein